MSKFYYTILKEIESAYPISHQIEFYCMQVLLAALSILIVSIGIILIISVDAHNNYFAIIVTLSILYGIYCWRKHRIEKKAQSLENIAKYILQNYNLKHLDLLETEVELAIRNSVEFSKWLSLIIASVITLISSQSATFYLKLFDHLPQKIQNELIQKILEWDPYSVIFDFLIPVAFLLVGAILSYFVIHKFLNHNKKLILIVLQNRKYLLIDEECRYKKAHCNEQQGRDEQFFLSCSQRNPCRYIIDEKKQ